MLLLAQVAKKLQNVQEQHLTKDTKEYPQQDKPEYIKKALEKNISLLKPATNAYCHSDHHSLVFLQFED